MYSLERAKKTTKQRMMYVFFVCMLSSENSVFPLIYAGKVAAIVSTYNIYAWVLFWVVWGITR
jgi:hypothetical protein